MVVRSSRAATASSGGPPTSAQRFIGIDVSKSWVDIADTTGRKARVTNDRASLAAAFVGPWSRENCGKLICEATGGYERPLLDVAEALGLPLCRVHPSRAHAFAKAKARLAKTDTIDAATLASFAAFTAEETAPGPPSPAQRALAELATRLAQLIDQRQAERCRVQQTGSPVILASLKASVGFLDTQIKALHQAIEDVMAADPVLTRKALLLRSCKCVGPRSVHAILAWLPEIGTLNRRAVAALVGVAPITRNSGSSIRTASIAGGRKPLRDVCSWPHSRPAGTIRSSKPSTTV